LCFAPIVAGRFGRQAACPFRLCLGYAPSSLPVLTRRDAGLIWPLLPNPELCNGKTSGQATLVSIQYARKWAKTEASFGSKYDTFEVSHWVKKFL